MQLNTKGEYHGRAMSIYTLVFSGSPIGNLYAGMITDLYNSRIGFIARGLIIVLLNCWLLFYYQKNSTSVQG